MSQIKPSVYLIKDGITDPRKIFRKDVKLNSVTRDETILFYLRSKSYQPDWAGFLTDNFDVDGKSFKNSSSRAILVVKSDGRLFAIPLGHGIHFIDLTKTDYNFGLKTALNCIPKSAIRQIDTTTPEVNSQKTKRQAVIGTTPEDFGINKQKDILRGVTGKLPINHELGKSLDGKDSLRVSINIENLEKLKSLCSNLLKLYKADTYKKDYDWIDNIALVRDNSLIESLNKKLIKHLKSALFEDMYFVPPVFFDTVFDYQGFAFTAGAGIRLTKIDVYEMPEMIDWKKSVGGARKNLTEETFENHKVVLIGDDKHAHYTWPLQRCLAWETGYGMDKYILSEGSWYCVASNFFKEVNDFFLSKLSDRKELPIPSKSKIKESDYNKEISDSSKSMYLFDLGHSISREKYLGSDRNEVCDIYNSETRTFYHVKMGKASADISHLLRQGAFSGMILKRDDNIRQQFVKHLENYGLKASVVPQPYMPSQYKIVFVLVLGLKQKKTIPFFSKVSFRDVVQNSLELFGYNCTITLIGGSK